MLVNNLDLKSHRYGLIGTQDWFMFPIVPPGSLVVIDDTRRRIASTGWNTEWERPIYFLEHRDRYLCGWCTLREGQLIVQPHPASFSEPEIYAYPSEIEVLGQVTHVGMALGLKSTRARFVPERFEQGLQIVAEQLFFHLARAVGHLRSVNL